LNGDAQHEFRVESELSQTFSFLAVLAHGRYVRPVTDSPTPLPGPRYRLRTFGPPALAGAEDDTILGQHGHHRRRLALLAVLAANGDRGRSRDQLLVLFWPDATQTRARHSLDQLLYALRSSLGESVFEGASPVRLNSQVMKSDVRAFNDALERGDLEAAIDEYRGPFLDGFYLNDAPEFEQWVEAERSRLAAGYAGALERLAQAATAAPDHSAAVRWWRALAETDPVSSKYATGFISALTNAGDHAAALQHAKRHEAVIASELGVSAGPEMATLVDEVRAKTRRPPEPAAPSPATATPLTSPTPPVAGDAVPPHRSQSPRSRRPTTPYVVGAMVTLAAIIMAVFLRPMSGGGKAPTAVEASIAVLPFANVSGAHEEAPLVDGLTEELTAVLAKLGHVRVIGGSSVLAFKNSDIGARRVADSLRVSYLLEGSVQKVDSQLRVQVRLIDARDGSTRWSETYDRRLRDIFLVQSDIAGAVARALDLELGATTLAAIRRGSTSSIAAYELYLHGNDPSLTRSDSGARAGLEYFQQAIALDPNYAAAYAGLARMQMRLANGDDKETTHRLALGEQAALKAVALGDSVGDAHAALGLVRKRNNDLASAETELTRAVTLEPTNPRFREWLSQLYVATERPREALVEARHAQEFDPLSPTANAEVANALIANGRCDEALVQLDKLRLLRQPLLRAGHSAAVCYARKQMWPEAIAEMQRISVNAGPRGQAMLGYVLARGGHTAEARQILAAALDRERRTKGNAFTVAAVYAGLGEKDQAFTWLDKSLDDRSLQLDTMSLIFDDLRRDPRFDRFHRRLNGQNR
jgi:TolB-like protein/DNA-binding SARP family transcriptional activator